MFSAAHFGQRLDSGLPHSAQNFLALVLSVPHLVQRIVLNPERATGFSIITKGSPGTSRERGD